MVLHESMGEGRGRVDVMMHLEMMHALSLANRIGHGA